MPEELEILLGVLAFFWDTLNKRGERRKQRSFFGQLRSDGKVGSIILCKGYTEFNKVSYSRFSEKCLEMFILLMKTSYFME